MIQYRDDSKKSENDCIHSMGLQCV